MLVGWGHVGCRKRHVGELRKVGFRRHLLKEQLTGARLMAAAKETLERMVVVVIVMFLTCTKAVGTMISPPPEQVEKLKKLMNDCSPAASRVTWPSAEGSVWVNAEDSI